MFTKGHIVTDDIVEGTPIRARLAADAPQRATHCLLAMNIFVMLLLTWTITVAVEDVNAKIDATAAELTSPTLITKMLSEVGGTWLAGALDGSLPVFLQRYLFGLDITSFAQAALAFSTAVEKSFDNVPPPPSCYDPFTCPSNGQFPFIVQCSNGATKYCDYGGQVINCADESCIAKNVMSAASYVKAVSEILVQFRSVTVPSSSSVAAFHSGVFNLSAIVPWLEVQLRREDWAAAGTACQQFVSAVTSLTYSGHYKDQYGHERTFDVTKDVDKVAGYVSQICNDLASLTEQRQHSVNA